MRPHIDWLAGFSVTVGWVAAVWLTSLAVEWREPAVWIAVAVQIAFAALVTAMVIYLKSFMWSRER